MKVILATGGSGGHLFPAIQVARILKSQGHEVVFAGSLRVGADRIQREGFAFYKIHSQGFQSRNPIVVIKTIWNQGAAFGSALRYVREFQPDVVLGFGSYSSFAVMLAAVCLRVPTLLHEQNVRPGKANSVLSKFVSRVAISFKESEVFFHSRKVVFTGCPSHGIKAGSRNRFELYNYFGLKEGVRTVLVMGGSQGSRRINEVFLRTAQLLKKKELFQVIHIAGSGDLAALENEYRQKQIPCAVFSFLEDMDAAYQISDVVVSRAGAGTVTELALYQRPSVLIPYPFAGGHQKLNARILVDAGWAVMIEESCLTPESLLDALRKFFQNKELSADSLTGRQMPDAAQHIVKAALSLVKT